MRQRGCSLLMAALGASLFSLAHPGQAAAAPPPACLTLDPAVAVPAATGAQHGLIAVGTSLAEDGRLDAAEHLFELARTSEPADTEAGTGLAYVTARRIAAEKAVAEARRLDRQRLADRDAASAEAAAAKDAVDACFAEASRLDRDNAAAAAGSAPTATAAPAADRFDSFYKARVDPTVRVLVPTLVVLAVLLVLARALTPYVVRPAARAWPQTRRAVAWGTGFVLLVVATTLGVSLAVGVHWLPARWGWGWLPPALVGVVLAAGVVVARFSLMPAERGRSPSAASTSGRLAWTWSVLVAVLVMVALTVPVVTGRRGEAGSWVVAAAVACLGLVLVATARGHALRLLVQVKKGTADDPPGTAYVLARLQELGSSPPEGLRTPQQLDVENLPTAALKSLPAGRVATVLLPLINLVLPGAPWRAVVEGGDASSRVVVTVTRNGSVVRTALVDAGRFLPAPSNDPTPSAVDGADRGDLLTAAAAVVLTELSKVHVELTKGLCGASRWESVAAYVVATKPPATAGGSELRRELLAYAVQEDPLNSLGQLAYANLQGEQASGAGQLREYADRLERVLRDIEEEGAFAGAPGSVVWGELCAQLLAAARTSLQAGEATRSQARSVVAAAAQRLVEARNAAERTPAAAGYLPLCLRAQHALTATWLNVAVEERDATQAAAVAKAAVHFRSLVQLLEMPRETGDEGRDVFREEMSRVAWALKRAFASLAQIGYPEPQLPDPPAAPGGRELTSLHVAYDDACRLAHAGEVDAAVKALERAAGLERNRKGALVDPWFADLRAARSADVHAVLRYWEIVGPPAEAFTDLPPFGTHASALRALGVTGARDLLVVTADRGEALAASLEIPKTVTAAWWAFARLAEPRGRRARWLDARELRLLWEIGVRSDDDLTTAMQQPGLSTRLVEAAERLVVRPPTDSESALILLPRPDAGKGADSRRTRVAGQPRRRSPVSR